MKTNNRRDFLKKSAGAASLGAMIAANSWASANDAVRIGVVGLKGRGVDHIKSFGEQKNVEVAALCDVDEKILNQRAEELKDFLKNPVKKFTDVREMLKDKEIDAISIATPNHWHAIIGIWSCQAGKDVYVEKPCCHNLAEGQKLLEASRKYDRIVQHGTQSRCSAAIREAIDNIRSGAIGEVYYAKGICYKWRDTIGHKPEAPEPVEFHYDLWTGPAKKLPFTENRYHYNWHWQWNYGNGDIGNQGVHEMDVARWGLGVELPSAAQALGGHFMFDDDQETPNCLVASFKYPQENKMLVFEVRHWITNDEIDSKDENTVGVVFLGSKGYIVTDRWGERYRMYMGRERKLVKEKKDAGNPFANFIKAVRSRKREDQQAEIREGYLSVAHIHLANAAYRVERTLHFDAQTQKCLNDDEANAILYGQVRSYRAPYLLPEEI
ncbi:MAG: Gfo/Idh/MocA family oxidoreductase [Candidatus Omnitrophota bacterium]